MRGFSASDIVLKVLGLLLLTAAVLKGHELLAVPVANKNLWSWRPFLIFQVEFELALGIWLLSRVFKRLAWLAALTCFGLFCCITLYKGLTGVASCGCFGRIHVNPWITLTAVDLPAVISLSLLRPGCLFGPFLSFLRKQASIHRLFVEVTKPSPSPPQVAVTAGLGLIVLSLTAPILALNKPATATSAYEVLEPETWVGKELPIPRYIDIGEQLKKGTWLLLFYHHDCPDCQKAVPRYQQMTNDLKGNEDFLRIALIEVPPYEQGAVSEISPWTTGRLANVKEWFVTTPVVALLANGKVTFSREGEAPSLETILTAMVPSASRSKKVRKTTSTPLQNALEKGG